MPEEIVRERVWWLLVGWFNDQGIVPDIFKVERMVDLVMCGWKH